MTQRRYAAWRGLFEAARAMTQELVRDLAASGLEVDEGLEVHRVEGLLCYCDLSNGHLYLGLLDPDEPAGPLFIAVLRSIYGCESDEELARLVRAMLMFSVGHELAHHLRRARGLFGNDAWLEEHIANELGAALVRHRLTNDERALLRACIPRALAHLASDSTSAVQLIDASTTLVESLALQGTVSAETLCDLEMESERSCTSPAFALDTSLRAMGLGRRIDERHAAVATFNRDYADDPIRYVCLQSIAMLLALDHPVHRYVDVLAMHHFARCSPDATPENIALRTREALEAIDSVPQLRALPAGTRLALASRTAFVRLRGGEQLDVVSRWGTDLVIAMRGRVLDAGTVVRALSDAECVVVPARELYRLADKHASAGAA